MQEVAGALPWFSWAHGKPDPLETRPGVLPTMLGHWPVRQRAGRQYGLRACCAHTLNPGPSTNSKEGKTQVASFQQFLTWSKRDPKHFLTTFEYKNEWCFTKNNQW